MCHNWVPAQPNSLINLKNDSGDDSQDVYCEDRANAMGLRSTSKEDSWNLRVREKEESKMTPEFLVLHLAGWWCSLFRKRRTEKENSDLWGRWWVHFCSCWMWVPVRHPVEMMSKLFAGEEIHLHNRGDCHLDHPLETKLPLKLHKSDGTLMGTCPILRLGLEPTGWNSNPLSFNWNCTPGLGT